MISELALRATDEEPHAVSNDAALSLADLGPGDQCVIVAIRPNPAFGQHDEGVTRRLKELGFLPGAPVAVVAFGAFRREPVAVRVAEGTFALRRQEAAKVLITRSSR